MKAKCAKCGKLFDVAVIDRLVMVCDECSMPEMPDIFKEIFK